MTALVNRSRLEKGFALLRNRFRWLYRPPMVRGSVPSTQPGIMSMGHEEEEAAAQAAREVIRSKRLFRYFGASRNPFETSRVDEFEKGFREMVGVKHALAVNSGTSALVVGLRALGVGPGDEVIVPAYTWFSTPSCVLDVGAVPIIVEVDESLTLDPEAVKKAITPYTKAIIPVHVRGQPANMDALMEIAREHNLFVMEDTAQADGGSYKGKQLGSIGHLGIFSFHPTKIISTGEGGMITTNDKNIIRRATMYHDSAAVPHMGLDLDEWLYGVNLRMSELDAAVGVVQLRRLKGLISEIRARKARIKEIVLGPLEEKGIVFRRINDPDGDTCIVLIFYLPTPDKAKSVVAALKREQVPANAVFSHGVHLPYDSTDLHSYTTWTPILNKRTWSANGGPWRWHPREVEYSKDMCPRTQNLLARAVNIHISPDLTDEQVEQMGAAIVKVIQDAF